MSGQGPSVSYGLQAAAVIGGTVETLIGGASGTIDTAYMSSLTLWIEYTAGTEGTVYIVPRFKHPDDTTWYQWLTFSATAGDRSSTANRLLLGATGNYYYTFDVRGIDQAAFYTDVDGTVASGTIQAKVTLTDR